MKILEFSGFKLRVLDWPDSPLFVLVDICKVLGYSNPAMVSVKLSNSQKALSKIETLDGGPQNTTVVTRQGFFEILKKSSKKNAPELLDWLLTKVFRLSDRYSARRKKMAALSKQLGFRLSQEKGRWTYRSEGRRRKATEEEIKLWTALKAQMEQTALAESHAVDRDFAFAWIETHRQLRQLANNVISQSAELSRLSEKAAQHMEDHSNLFKSVGESNKASRCKTHARQIRGAIRMHSEAARLAREGFGIEPRKEKKATPGAANLPELKIPKS